MSILDEIRSQPLWARELMFGCSIVVTISLVGMAWFQSFQQNLYALNNPGQDIEDQRFYAEGEGPGTGPLALIGKSFDGLKAGVYGLLNIRPDDNADVHPQAVYPMPLSPDRQK